MRSKPQAFRPRIGSDFKVSLGRRAELLITSTSANLAQNSSTGAESHHNHPPYRSACNALSFIQLIHVTPSEQVSPRVHSSSGSESEPEGEEASAWQEPDVTLSTVLSPNAIIDQIRGAHVLGQERHVTTNAEMKAAAMKKWTEEGRRLLKKTSPTCWSVRGLLYHRDDCHLHSSLVASGSFREGRRHSARGSPTSSLKEQRTKANAELQQMFNRQNKQHVTLGNCLLSSALYQLNLQE